MNKRTLVVATTSVFFVSPLSAQDNEGVDTVRFRYAPEETETIGGATVLLERINSYAQKQCRHISSTRTRNPKSEECVADLVKQLVTLIDSPRLHEVASTEEQVLAAPTE